MAHPEPDQVNLREEIEQIEKEEIEWFELKDALTKLKKWISEQFESDKQI